VIMKWNDMALIVVSAAVLALAVSRPSLLQSSGNPLGQNHRTLYSDRGRH
jgi:hypothetical protein